MPRSMPFILRLKLVKCLIIFQIHGMPCQPSALVAVCLQLTAFVHLPLQTAGAVLMGLPIGHLKFIRDFLAEV